MVFWKNVFFFGYVCALFKEQLWKILKAWEVDSSWNCDIKSATILISCHIFGSFRAWRGEFHRPHGNEMYLKFCVGVLPSDTSQRRPFEAWVMLIMVIFYAIMLVYITARRLVRKTANIWPCTTEQLSSYASIAFGIWCFEVRMFWCVQYNTCLFSSPLLLDFFATDMIRKCTWYILVPCKPSAKIGTKEACFNRYMPSEVNHYFIIWVCGDTHFTHFNEMIEM